MITPLVSSDYTFDIFKLVLCIFDIIIIEILMILFYFPVTCWKAYLYNESQQILYRIKTNNHLSSQINEHQNKKNKAKLEEFKDTKGVVRIRISMKPRHML
jgi:hypothetical protein